jgi:dihydrofolate reductase
MGKVFLEMSVSLDGYIAGPNDELERLHSWMFDGKTATDVELLDEMLNEGALVIGRRMFNLGEEPWGENPGFHMPVFVLSHQVREKVVKEDGTTFTFVTDGIESAVRQAKATAGNKNVGVAGATIAQQCLKARLLDEIHLHLVPVLLGEGIRLFDHIGTESIELERTKVIEAPGVTHLSFRIVT